MIARGPGAGLAGVVCQPRPSDPARDDIVCVQFDMEPGARYWTSARALDHEAIQKKPPMPSVARRGRARAVRLT